MHAYRARQHSKSDICLGLYAATNVHAQGGVCAGACAQGQPPYDDVMMLGDAHAQQTGVPCSHHGYMTCKSIAGCLSRLDSHAISTAHNCHDSLLLCELQPMHPD